MKKFKTKPANPKPPVITTRSFMTESLNRHELERMVGIFNEKVWPDMLKANIDEPSVRGFSVRLGTTDVLTWCCAGRILINFKRKDSIYLSLCGGDFVGGKCGIQGMRATYQQMFDMMQDVFNNWEFNKTNYKTDKNIGLGI